MKGYPRWYNSYFISATVILLTVSGLVLIPGVLELQLDIVVPWRLSGGARLVGTALHTILSYGSLVLVGSLWSIHMRREWRRRKKVFTGILLTLIFLLLSLTAVSLLYSGSERVQFISTLVHTGLGIVLLFLYLIHLILKKD